MLVNCVAYDRGQKLADIPLGDIRSHLERPDCFVWVALKDPEPAELAALQEEFGLHELAVEDAQKGHQRPKIEEYGASLFVVLHLIEPAGDGTADRRSRDLRRAAVHRLGAPRRAARLHRGAPALRAGAGAAAARARLRALRADGHRRRSLLPGARRAHRGDRRASRSGSSPARPRARRSRRSIA